MDLLSVPLPPLGKPRAFAYANEMRELGALGGESSQANAVNNNGQIVGWAGDQLRKKARVSSRTVKI